MSKSVEVTADEGVQTIRLNRPHARNALSTTMLEALCEALRAADTDEAVAVVVLTGADPAFCAGLDLRELADPETDLLRTIRAPATNPFAALDAVRCPVIAAVNGPAITGGLELALHCDFILASDRARFGDSHGRVGVVPGGGLTGLLPQSVGLRRAKELSFTGRLMDAAEALRTGLVNEVLPHESLLSAVAQRAQVVSSGDRRTIREIKRLYDAGSLRTLEECHRIEAEAHVTWTVSPEDLAVRRDAIIPARGPGRG